MQRGKKDKTLQHDWIIFSKYYSRIILKSVHSIQSTCACAFSEWHPSSNIIVTIDHIWITDALEADNSLMSHVIYAPPTEMLMEVKSEYYLKTLSEAWLDLEPSQPWCFSWALDSFSAAAMGHPDRLKWKKRLRWHVHLRHILMLHWMHMLWNVWLVRVSSAGLPAWKQLVHTCLSANQCQRLPDWKYWTIVQKVYL